MVTNVGANYSGKEVAQLYVSAPAGKVDKEFQSLAAFAKTKILAPVESEVSQKEKDKHCILMRIYGIQKDGNDDHTCRAAKETQM